MLSFLLTVEERVRGILTAVVAGHPDVFAALFYASRLVLAALAVWIALRVTLSLLSGNDRPETWAFLNLQNGAHIPVNHWENVVGRARNSDILLNFPTVSRNHAALIRTEEGRWQIEDLGSKGGTSVNGVPAEGKTEVSFFDTIAFGGIQATIVPLTAEEQQSEQRRQAPGEEMTPALTLFLLTVFDLILLFDLVFRHPADLRLMIPVSFLLLLLLMWAYFWTLRMRHWRGYEVETIAFFLSSVCLSVTASSAPSEVPKQLLAVVCGMVLFVILSWYLRDLKRANRARWTMGAAAIGLLLLTLVAGRVINGARNWIFIAGFSVQPSELSKLCFVYAGAATLDRLFARRNLILYIALTACCGGALAYMGDFGAAMIFFVAFLVIAFMRTGDLAMLSLTGFGALLGVFFLLRFKPYIAARFQSWGRVWQVPHDGGYQQTRAMSAAASGGFFGVGAGNGWLKNIPAADTDLVFGVVLEELGLIVGLVSVALVLVLAIFSYMSASRGRSTFYTILAVASTTMLVTQMSLNVLGTMDLLPLTGVTFPFVSNGGTSMVSCFGMLAFVKAADTRRLSGFATARPGRKRGGA